MAAVRQPSLKEERENIRQNCASSYEGPSFAKMISRMNPRNTSRAQRRMYFVALRRVNPAAVAHLIDETAKRRVFHMVKGKSPEQFKAEKANQDTVKGILAMAKEEQAKAEREFKRYA